MIGYLKGKVKFKEETHIILVINDIGYQVFLTERALNGIIPKDQEKEFFIYHHIREDNQTLYGFETLAEKKLFLALTSVSGVGPRTAMAFLAELPAEDIITAIAHGDLVKISGMTGIGKKTAEKVIVELKEKILKVFPDIKKSVSDKNKPNYSVIDIEEGFKTEIQQALTSLGYSNKEIEKVILKNIDKLREVGSVEDGIRLVLQNLH